MVTSRRAGRFVRQPAGYTAFIPAPLPPSPPIEIDAPMLDVVTRAEQALGRLDGIGLTLPNPDLFVAMYVRREAVYSSQIEGTQSSLDDVLAFELDESGRELPTDVEEVVNYVQAMNYGLQRLQSLPLSLRLIREIHGRLLQGVRGAERSPGEFRASQNWIGPANTPLAGASFVPPPVAEMHASLDNFERFLHTDASLPISMLCGIAHAQFETIHPFLDGNGRVGRLLITFILCQRAVLQRPLLYLSYYLRRHRSEYYDRLTAIRHDGDWEGWLRFFLRGIIETAEEATATARSIVHLREVHRSLIQEARVGTNGLRLHDLLFQQPLVNARLVGERLSLSPPTVTKLIDRFVDLGLLAEVTGQKRNRRFVYTPYVDLFAEDADEPPDESGLSTPERTESARD